VLPPPRRRGRVPDALRLGLRRGRPVPVWAPARDVAVRREPGPHRAGHGGAGHRVEVPRNDVDGSFTGKDVAAAVRQVMAEQGQGRPWVGADGAIAPDLHEQGLRSGIRSV
jgi:hypothetical protein